MKVRPAKIAPQRKMRGGEPTQKPAAQTYTFPAPIRGWVLNESLAMPQPGGAAILDNWICTTTGIRARGGAVKYADLGASVKSMFTYNSTTEKFFGATDAAIYEITTVADPDVTPTAAVTGQTAGYYSAEQFGTPGGDYLYAVNGADLAQLYDGSTWTQITGVSTPAITGVTTSNLSHVWSFANRLFFVEEGSKSAWYLPVDSIGGGATEFSLAGIFKKGGSLLFGGTWSLDAGDGLDDKCVFVSTEGEVAIYQGTNPGVAADWSKVGLYEISKPLGKNATMNAGGDLLIATAVGLVPISAAIQKDKAALSYGAVSAPISPYWQEQVTEATAAPWEILKWPRKNIIVVSQPKIDGDAGSCLVANLQTGAWSRITGWVTRCMGYFDDSGFFGNTAGGIYRMDVGGNDAGAIYTCAYLGNHEGMNAGGAQKTIHQMRAQFQTATPILPLVSATVDYDQTLSGAPASPGDFAAGVWDSALWDAALWDATGEVQNVGVWASVGRTGYAIAPEVQISFGITPTPNVELVSVDATYSIGAVVT